MRECTENLDRAKLFQKYLHTDAPLNFDAMDMLALGRIRPALADPRGEIEKITEIPDSESLLFGWQSRPGIDRRRNGLGRSARMEAERPRAT